MSATEFEPAAHRLSTCALYQLEYTDLLDARQGIRTPNLLVLSQAPLPIGLHGQDSLFF